MSLLSGIAPVDAVLGRPHGLLEAPRFGAAGELVFSDVTGGGLYACEAGGAVRELLPRRRGIGGAVAHADGGWVLSGRTVLHLGADGGQRELLAEEDATGYNDLGTTPAGDLLAGVLRFNPMAGEEPRPGRLLRLSAGGARQVLSETIVWPNGIGVAPGGETVYASDYARRQVIAVPADGGSDRVFAASPRGSADGLAVDVDGGVWVALGEGGGVARFDPAGELDELVELPAAFVSSICFGGEDGREVLITTADNRVRPDLGGTLLRARSAIAGAPVYPARV